jgi:hypothetical protein
VLCPNAANKLQLAASDSHVNALLQLNAPVRSAEELLAAARAQAASKVDAFLSRQAGRLN